MVEILHMMRGDLASWIKSTDEPEVRARRRYLAKEFIGADPDLEAEVTAKGRTDGERKALRVVLAQRGLVPSAEENARIDACTDPSTLERWLAQAMTAPTVAEALR
jgi:hypothetical protein